MAHESFRLRNHRLGIYAAANPSKNRNSLLEVLKHWEGLGYYSRARNLHRLCRSLHSSENQWPATPKDWQKFSGIGPYTATAIGSIGQNFDAICLDGNVIRVLARTMGIEKTFPQKLAAEKFFRPYADKFILPGHCAQINEALMDLGATVCLPKNSHCERCPLRTFCVGNEKNLNISNIPSFSKVNRSRAIIYRIFALRRGKILLQRSLQQRLIDIHELPQVRKNDEKLAKYVHHAEKRTIGNRSYEERFVALDSCFADYVDLSAGPLTWKSFEKINHIVLSGPHRRWLPRLIEKFSSDEK
ncbi:MAG: hypothetical protein LBI69_00240 [Puniceicoccales bacterium]|jgi:A/G-specific adenine glycosylase|nr:hypothetical protein [Puniceicoccales bacterium]